MSETPDTIIHFLRGRFDRVDRALQDLTQETRELRWRVSSIEQAVAQIHGDLARLDLRLDRVHDRLDRVERRLGLAEETAQ